MATNMRRARTDILVKVGCGVGVGVGGRELDGVGVLVWLTAGSSISGILVRFHVLLVVTHINFDACGFAFDNLTSNPAS